MSRTANVSFENKSWEEAPYDEMDAGPKLTCAHVAKEFRGDLEGESSLTYLMMHREDGTAIFQGLERVVGSLFGKAGTFVLEHRGSFESGTATTNWTVVPGSATGDLRGLRGEGTFALRHADRYDVALDFDLE